MLYLYHKIYKDYSERRNRNAAKAKNNNGKRVAPLSLYAIIKEIHEIERFQLIQIDDIKIEFRLIAKDK